MFVSNILIGVWPKLSSINKTTAAATAAAAAAAAATAVATAVR